MSKIFALIFPLIAALGVSAQIKSIESAKTEIGGFKDSSSFSVFYDENSYLTTVELKFDPIAESDALRKIFARSEITATVQFAIKGIDKKPVRSTVCLQTQAKTFKFSRDNELQIKLESEVVEFGAPNRKSEVKRGKATETLCWEAGMELFTDLSKTDQISFQIGEYEFRIDKTNADRFDDFLALISVAESS